MALFFDICPYAWTHTHALAHTHSHTYTLYITFAIYIQWRSDSYWSLESWHVLFCLFVYLKTGFLYVALAVLQLTLSIDQACPRLTEICLPLPHLNSVIRMSCSSSVGRLITGKISGPLVYSSNQTFPFLWEGVQDSVFLSPQLSRQQIYHIKDWMRVKKWVLRCE